MVIKGGVSEGWVFLSKRAGRASLHEHVRMYTAQENNLKTGGHPSASGQPKFTTPLGASILAIFCILTQTIHMEASTITVVKLKTEKKALLFLSL